MEDFECNIDFEEEFRSCCEDEEWQDPEFVLTGISDEESINEGICDDHSIKLWFKGVSVNEAECLGSNKASGIGVVLENSNGDSIIKVQKKLDFYVDNSVAEHLALLDGLTEAKKRGADKIIAFTDCEEVYHQIAEVEPHENQLLVALGYRILELSNTFESFDLKLACISELERPLQLAQEAVGISDTIHCPFPNCSALLDLNRCSPSSENSSIHANCIECANCNRLLCTSCVVPWHFSMSCEEFQDLHEEEIDDAMVCLVQDNKWRRCPQCDRIVELTQGCFHVACWCGYEFCYSCNSPYHNTIQTCQCQFQNNTDEEEDDDDEEEEEEEDPYSDNSTPAYYEDEHLWRWEDPFDHGYSEQERSQLALIQRFLSGGLLNDDNNDDFHGLNSSQIAPRCSNSYYDAIKDLNQLPWLERFVSVISDTYQEDYYQ